MPAFIVAIILALASAIVYAEEHSLTAPLDLRLTKEVIAPVPVYIINSSHPDTFSSVRRYALSVLQQIDAEFKSKPTLNKDGRPFCIDMIIDSLVTLDKNGQFIDIQFKHDPTQGPPDLRKEVEENLRLAAQHLSPFPSFPEAERLGSRLVGIPAKMTVQCKRDRVWKKVPAW